MEAALSYLPDDQRRAVPEGWIPDPNKLAFTHLIAAQRRARIMNIDAPVEAFTYRMTNEAVRHVEAGLMLVANVHFNPMFRCSACGCRRQYGQLSVASVLADRAAGRAVN